MSRDPALASLSEALRDARNAAQARVDAVRHLSYAVQMLRNMRFAPVVEVSEDGARISVVVDLDDWHTSTPAPEIEVVEAEPKAALAAEAQRDSLKSLTQALFLSRRNSTLEVEAAASEAAPEPAHVHVPKPAPAVSDAAPLKVGPFSDEERKQVADMLAEGWSCAVIAQRLNRGGQAVGAIIGKLRKAEGKAKEKSNLWPKQIKPIDEIGPAPVPEVQAEPKPEPKPAAVRPAGTFLADIPNAEGWAFAERAINARLNSLGYDGGWYPTADLSLAEVICRDGSKSLKDAQIGGSWRNPEQCLARWQALNSKPGDIQHQEKLLRVLRYRATDGQA